MTLIDPRIPVTIDFGAISITGRLEHLREHNSLDLLTDEGVEHLSVDLSISNGIVPEPGNVIIKDWSEHHGLATRMEAAGLVRIVKLHTVRPHGAGGYTLEAYEVEVNLA